jgi:hypothetical protein
MKMRALNSAHEARAQITRAYVALCACFPMMQTMILSSRQKSQIHLRTLDAR